MQNQHVEPFMASILNQMTRPITPVIPQSEFVRIASGLIDPLHHALLASKRPISSPRGQGSAFTGNVWRMVIDEDGGTVACCAGCATGPGVFVIGAKLPGEKRCSTCGANLIDASHIFSTQN